MVKKKKSKVRKNWNMKATAEWTDRLAAASEILEKPAAQIVREATKEKLEELAAQNPRLRAALAEFAA